MEKYKNIARQVLDLAIARGADKAQCSVYEGELREFNVEGNEFSLFRTLFSRSVSVTVFLLSVGESERKPSIFPLILLPMP